MPARIGIRKPLAESVTARAIDTPVVSTADTTTPAIGMPEVRSVTRPAMIVCADSGGASAARTRIGRSRMRRCLLSGWLRTLHDNRERRDDRTRRAGDDGVARS